MSTHVNPLANWFTVQMVRLIARWLISGWTRLRRANNRIEWLITSASRCMPVRIMFNHDHCLGGTLIH